MTAFLPPNLLALFAPRDAIPHLPPVSKLGHEKKRLGYGGVAIYTKEFEDPKDTPPPTRVETRDERIERKRREKAEQVAYKLEQDLALWDPNTQPNTTKDAFKTLFVARINYDTSESKLRREFEMYGPVKKIRLVLDEEKSLKPRGYAFIEFERERDMHNAYKSGDGKKIDGRRVLVDVERGRTVKGWRPRRLGGGLGSTRKGGPDENTKYSGREDNPRREEDRREDEREKRRRSRSRSKGREERPRRSRSRDRRRREKEEEDKKRKRSRRSRSRDRSKRSRSRDRRRSRRSKDRGAEKPPPDVENLEQGEYPVEGMNAGRDYDGYGGEMDDQYNGHETRGDQSNESMQTMDYAHGYSDY